VFPIHDIAVFIPGPDSLRTARADPEDVICHESIFKCKLEIRNSNFEMVWEP
jgi:hypothetical protein